MRITILSILVNLCLLLQAQIYNYPIPISATTTHVTEKNGKGIFVAQKIKGKISGSGLYQGKDESIYIGDFKDKVFNGTGMFIASPEENISNCPNATVYVGRFKNGIKNGNGICYNSAGEAIYIGKFLDDVPIDNYGDSVVSPIKYLSDAKTEKFYYIGEFSSDLPNGFGAIFFQNGDLLISKFKDGVCDGICIYLETDGNWTTENVSRDEISFISSSREYASYVQQSKSEWNAAWKKALGSWEDWSAAFANLSNQLQQISDSSGSSSLSYSSNNAIEGGNSRNSKSSGGNTKYNMSEQRAYNSDKSTYSKYDSMLAAAFAGNRNASPSEISQWQNKMKSLRKKWEAKGRSFSHSNNEDR